MKLPKEAHKTLIQAISMSLSHKDDEMTSILGKLLHQCEDEEIRRIENLSDYTELAYMKFIDTPYTKKVYRLTSSFLDHSEYELCTVKQYSKQLGVPEKEALADMLESFDQTIVIGEVNEEIVNSFVTVHVKGTVRDYGLYYDIASKYGIHVEDLQTVIEESILIDDQYKFKFVEVKK